jgi:hypothetical protein
MQDQVCEGKGHEIQDQVCEGKGHGEVGLILRRKSSNA